MAGMWTPRTAFQAEGMAVWERLAPCISLPPAWGPWVPRVCCSAPVLWSQYASCIASTSVGVQGPHSSGCTCPQTRVAGELPGSLGWPAWVCALWALPHCRYCGQGPWTVMAAGHHSTEGQGPSGPGLGAQGREEDRRGYLRGERRTLSSIGGRLMPRTRVASGPGMEASGGSVAKSCPTLATPWTIALQIPLSMGFSRQEYWTGLPFPSLGDLPHPGIEPGSPVLQADSLLTELPGPETATDCPGRGQGPALRSGWPDVPVQLGEPGWVGSWGHGFGPHRDQGPWFLGPWKTHPASRGLCFLHHKQSRDQSAHPRDGGTSQLYAGGGAAAHARAAVNVRCPSPPRTRFPQTHTGSAPSLPIPSFSNYKLILSKDLSVASGMWCQTHQKANKYTK